MILRRPMFLLFVLMLFLLSGCITDIIEKVAKGEALSGDEKKEYAEYVKDPEKKKSFDEAVAKKKKEIAENSYIPPTEEQKKLGIREYHNTELKISPLVCDQLGFLEGSRVKTPDGEGYFVGVDKDGDGWFHLDGKTSLNYYKGGKDEYIKKGFKVVAAPSQDAQHEAKKETEELVSKPAPSAPINPPPKSAPGSKTAVAGVAASESVEMQEGEIEKLSRIPPIPPLQEK